MPKCSVFFYSIEALEQCTLFVLYNRIRIYFKAQLLLIKHKSALSKISDVPLHFIILDGEMQSIWIYISVNDLYL